MMISLENRGGVMLWILNMNGVCSEEFNRCLTMDRSMCCSTLTSLINSVTALQANEIILF